MKFENGQEVRYKGDKYYTFIYVGLYPKSEEHAVVCSNHKNSAGLSLVRIDEIEAVNEVSNDKS